MGKAVPKSLKTRAEILMHEFPKEMSHDFDKNKEFLNTFDLPLSKSQRNLVAGYIARKTEKPKEPEHRKRRLTITEYQQLLKACAQSKCIWLKPLFILAIEKL